MIDDDLAGVATTASLIVVEGEIRPLAISLNTSPAAGAAVTVTPPISSGDNYIDLTPASLDFVAGDGVKNFMVRAREDNIINATLMRNAMITYAVAVTSGTDASYTNINSIVPTVVTINDNDSANLHLPNLPTTLTLREGESREYMAVLTAQPTTMVTLRPILGGGRDALTVNRLEFTPSNWHKPQTLTIALAEDAFAYANGRTATIAFALSRGGEAYSNVSPPAMITVTLGDNDTAGLTETLPTDLTLDEGGSQSYTVKLDSQPTAAVRIIATIAAPRIGLTINGSTSPVTRTFDAENYATAQTFVIALAADAIDNLPAERADVSIAYAVVSADAAYNAMSIADTIVGLIDDEDPSGINHTLPANLRLPEGENRSYIIRLANPPTANVQITATLGAARPGLTINDSTSPVTLTSTPMDYGEKTLTIALANDTDDNPAGDRAAMMITYEVATTDPDLSMESIPSTAVTLVDNEDGASVTESLPLDLELAEGESRSFTVSITTQPTQNVRIMATVGAARPGLTINGSASTHTLTFDTENWTDGQSFIIALAADEIDNLTTERAAVLITYTVASTDNVYNAMTIDSTTVTLGDDDTANITATLPDTVTLYEGSGSQSTMTYTVKLDTEPTDEVQITATFDSARTGLTINNRTDSAVLTFTPTNYMLEQAFMIALANDDIDNPASERANVSITYRVESASDAVYNALTIAVTTVMLVDDDGASFNSGLPATLTLNEGESRDYTVNLTTVPTANVTIMATVSSNPIGDLTVAKVNETGRSTTSLTFTPMNWRDAQTLTFAAADDSTARLPRTAMITYTIGSSDTDYAALGLAATTVSLSDNDTAALAVTYNDRTVSDGHRIFFTGAQQSSSPGGASNFLMMAYTLALQSQPSIADVTVNISVEPEVATDEVGILLAGDAGNGAQSLVQNFKMSGSDGSGLWNEPVMITIMYNDTNVGGGRITHAVVGSTNPEYTAIDFTLGFDLAQSTEVVNKVVLPQIARSTAGHALNAISARAEQALSGGVIGAAGTTDQNASNFERGGLATMVKAILGNISGMAEGEFDWREIMQGVKFALPVGRVHAVNNASLDLTSNRPSSGDLRDLPPSNLAFWGGFDYRTLSGDDSGVDFDGTLSSIHFGFDNRFEHDRILGLAFARSVSDLDTVTSMTSATHKLTMTSINPYYGWRTADGRNGWIALGYGVGELEVENIGRTDVTMQSFGLGDSWAIATGGRTKFRMKGQITQSRIEVEGTEAIPAEMVNGQRLRFSLERSVPRVRASGSVFTSRLEVGIRYDAGDGVNGADLELTSTVDYVSPTAGITTQGMLHALVGHTGYEEWGFAGLFRADPNAAGRGLAISVEPSWGNTTNSIATMWQDNARALGTQAIPTYADTSEAPAARLDLRLAYGLGRHGITITPYHELTLTDTAADQYRLGIRWQTPQLELKLIGEQASDATGGVDNRFLLQGRLGF